MREAVASALLRTTRVPSTVSAPKAGTETHRFRPSHDRRLPLPGSILTRRYKGRTVAVTVLDQGFDYQGEIYRSLTAVAKAVTGTHWNGYHFFRLARKGNGNGQKER